MAEILRELLDFFSGVLGLSLVRLDVLRPDMVDMEEGLAREW